MASGREQFWRQRVEQQRTSGLTVRAYCERHQLREPSFYSWRRTLAERNRTAAAAAEPAFVPVEAPAASSPASAAAVEVHLPSGVRVSVTPGCAASHLAMVLAALEGRPC